ncbi:MAG: UPF0235 protein [Pirellulaceae bacterium]|nr:MAG: UPF0235 protein [Pirellulaceae bacterium]
MNDLPVRATADGTLLVVRVQPRARRNAVAGIHAGALKVCVSAPAEGGKANEALVRLLAELLEVAPGRLLIRHGATSRQKTVLIEGLSPNQVTERIRSRLPRSDS